MKRIILLSGPVGAGKTTVAKELVELFPAPVVCIEGDLFWSFVAKTEAEQTPKKLIRVTMSSMMAAALPYAMSGFGVILDFSIPPWFLETALRMASRREIELHYVVLMPSEAVCAERALERVEGRIEDYGEYSEFYSTFCFAAQEQVVSESLTPREMAELIRAGLEAGRFLVKA